VGDVLDADRASNGFLRQAVNPMRREPLGPLGLQLAFGFALLGRRVGRLVGSDLDRPHAGGREVHRARSARTPDVRPLRVVSDATQTQTGICAPV
jgi:hypothetical protein